MYPDYIIVKKICKLAHNKSSLTSNGKWTVYIKRDHTDKT